MLTQLSALVQGDPARMERANCAAADLAVFIALGWGWAGEWDTAIATLQFALEMTAGMAGYARIARVLERVTATAAAVARQQQVSVLRAIASSRSRYIPPAARSRWDPGD